MSKLQKVKDLRDPILEIVGGGALMWLSSPVYDGGIAKTIMKLGLWFAGCYAVQRGVENGIKVFHGRKQKTNNQKEK